MAMLKIMFKKITVMNMMRQNGKFNNQKKMIKKIYNL